MLFNVTGNFLQSCFFVFFLHKTFTNKIFWSKFIKTHFFKHQPYLVWSMEKMAVAPDAAVTSLAEEVESEILPGHLGCSWMVPLLFSSTPDFWRATSLTGKRERKKACFSCCLPQDSSMRPTHRPLGHTLHPNRPCVNPKPLVCAHLPHLQCHLFFSFPHQLCYVYFPSLRDESTPIRETKNFCYSTTFWKTEERLTTNWLNC